MAKRHKKNEEPEKAVEVKKEPEKAVKVKEEPKEAVKAKEEGGNGKDPGKGEELKPTVVNSDYDAMPDTVEDPGNVYRMAYLEARRTALENKRAYVELLYNNQIVNTRKKMSEEFSRIDNEVKELKEAHRIQREYIESKHGIALKSYDYNDETGVLTKQIPTGAEEVVTNG